LCAPVIAAGEDCNLELLNSKNLLGLTKHTYSLYFDMTSVVMKGLYHEAANLAGPEKTKAFHKQIDHVLITANEAYSQVNTAVAPAVGQAFEASGTIYKQLEPTFADLNKMLDKPLAEFAAKMPAHANLLRAESLSDKVILLVWLVVAMVMALRMIMVVLNFGLFVIFLPCRLLCGRRAEAPKTKKNFAGKGQASNGNANGTKNPAPPKRK
jgi:hypothetical protein